MCLLTKVEVLTEGYTPKMDHQVMLHSLTLRDVLVWNEYYKCITTETVAICDPEHSAQRHSTHDHGGLFAGCQTITIMITTKMLKQDLLLRDCSFSFPFSLSFRTPLFSFSH